DSARSERICSFEPYRRGGPHEAINVSAYCRCWYSADRPPAKAQAGKATPDRRGLRHGGMEIRNSRALGSEGNRKPTRCGPLRGEVTHERARGSYTAGSIP